MAISSNNVQVYTTLSKELVAEIDKDAKENFRTRSQQINMILTEYYKTKITTNDEGKRLVSARELHEKLILEEGKEERFSQWFKRHLQYGFEENID